MQSRSFLKKLKDMLLASYNKKSQILLWIQITLILFLIATLILVIFVDESSREILYICLLSSLILILFTAVGFNVSDKYERAAFLTVIATVIGPWVSIFLDQTIFDGDFVPLIYVSLSIQLCAILLSVRPTIIIAVFQLCMLLLCIFSNEKLIEINWPSLVSFIGFTSGISIVASYLSRKQYDQIKKQKERLQQDELQLREVAIRDSLTGLYNRRYLGTTLDREISRASRKNQSLGIIMADVDNFKSINDNFGHAFGDYVLSLVSELFINNMRSYDIVCRYGGDEFVLVMPDSTLPNALKRAEDLRQFVENTGFTFENKTINVSISLGVCAYPEHGMSADNLLRSADKALYAAKENGRNSVICAESV